MILVDTSVWVRHLRKGDDKLAGLLSEELVLCHCFIVGELACGSMKNREEILGLLWALPMAVEAGHDEVMHLVESRGLSGRGLGWVDAHLLASALISGCGLWTLDRSLAAAAAKLNIKTL